VNSAVSHSKISRPCSLRDISRRQLKSRKEKGETLAASRPRK
jgi:hypothetical protein